MVASTFPVPTGEGATYVNAAITEPSAWGVKLPAFTSPSWARAASATLGGGESCVSFTVHWTQ